jgi:metal transporter CNNM
MWMMAPLAWPTAKLLDWLLGEDHGTVYKKSGLKTLVTLHKNLGDVSERLNQDEVTIISAVLDLKAKPVESVMTPMSDVFIMSEDTVLDEETMDLILSAGYSRIPIHEPGKPTNFVGMLLVKILITYDPEDAKLVRDFPLATLPETRPETSCLDIVNFFQEGKSHMVLVSEYPGEDHGALGVVTLEDVIEELIGEEIIDESDVYIDVHKAIRRLTPAPKAKIQRGTSETQVHKAKDTETLVDTSDPSEAPPIARRPGSVSVNSDANLLSSSPRAATVMMRRSSAGIDGQLVKSTVPIRANLEEMRQHLRHLGPSNKATNPKNTRSTTVKIKPGIVTTSTRVGSTAGDIVEEAPPAADRHDDETTALLNTVSGKDGIQALHEHYGTVSPTIKSPPQAQNGGTQTTVAADEELADKGTQTRGLPPPPPQAEVVDTSPQSDDSVRSLPSDFGLPAVHQQQPKRYARSGSITENVIETRGVRKVVLETTSSNEEDESIIVARSPGGGSPKLLAATRSALGIFGGSKENMVAEEDEEDEGDDESGKGNGGRGDAAEADEKEGGGSAAVSNGDGDGGEGSGSGAASGSGSKAPGRKKNTKRKKRKGGKS